MDMRVKKRFTDSSPTIFRRNVNLPQEQFTTGQFTARAIQHSPNIYRVIQIHRRVGPANDEQVNRKKFIAEKDNRRNIAKNKVKYCRSSSTQTIFRRKNWAIHHRPSSP
jgi:hypothetical protein